jgi:mRNA interferase MazF
MSDTIKTSLSLKKTLFDQLQVLAQRLNISHSHLIQQAIEDFVRVNERESVPDQTSLDQSNSDETLLSILHDGKVDAQRGINQGDVYWLQVDDAHEGESPVRHPHVIVQDDVFNHSRLNTVVVCALTSNLKRINMPGNVLLDAGEANLPKQSVVEVSKVSAVNKTQLGAYIGTLSEVRIQQILAGMRFLQASFYGR